MIKEPLTIEDLEVALKIPSFEEELAMSDLPSRIPMGIDQSAHISKCKKCGTQFVVGPGGKNICPKSPHDPEDNGDLDMCPDTPYKSEDGFFIKDQFNDSNEESNVDEEFEFIENKDYGLY